MGIGIVILTIIFMLGGIYMYSPDMFQGSVPSPAPAVQEPLECILPKIVVDINGKSITNRSIEIGTFYSEEWNGPVEMRYMYYYPSEGEFCIDPPLPQPNTPDGNYAIINELSGMDRYCPENVPAGAVCNCVDPKGNIIGKPTSLPSASEALDGALGCNFGSCECILTPEQYRSYKFGHQLKR